MLGIIQANHHLVQEIHKYIQREDLTFFNNRQANLYNIKPKKCNKILQKIGIVHYVPLTSESLNNDARNSITPSLIKATCFTRFCAMESKAKPSWWPKTQLLLVFFGCVITQSPTIHLTAGNQTQGSQSQPQSCPLRGKSPAYSQLEKVRGQACASMGKLCSCSWHSALMVSL